MASIEEDRERHRQKIELEREKQRTAQINAKRKRKQQNDGFLERESIGRASSNKKILGDAVSAAGVGAATALWTATRPSPSNIFWGLAFVGLGAVTMLESQPGTILESGGAGTLGANSAWSLLYLFNLAK